MKFDSKVSELFFNSPLISSKHNLFWETIPYKLMSIEEWRENQWLNFFNPCDFNQYQQAMFCSPGLFKPLPRSIGSSETRCLYELISSRKNTNIMLLGCFASIFDTRVYSIDYEKNKVKKLHGFKLSVNHQKILSTILKIIQYEAGLKFLFDHISVLQGAVDEIERVKAVKLIVLAYSTLDEKFKQKTFNIMYTNLIGMSSYPFIDILRELKIYQKFSKNEDIQYQHIIKQCITSTVQQCLIEDGQKLLEYLIQFVGGESFQAFSQNEPSNRMITVKIDKDIAISVETRNKIEKQLKEYNLALTIKRIRIEPTLEKNVEKTWTMEPEREIKSSEAFVARQFNNIKVKIFDPEVYSANFDERAKGDNNDKISFEL